LAKRAEESTPRRFRRGGGGRWESEAALEKSVSVGTYQIRVSLVNRKAYPMNITGVEILPLPVRLTGAMLSLLKDAQLESGTCSPEKDGDEIMVSGSAIRQAFGVKRAKFR